MPRAYHHGNLRRAIMDTALAIAEEAGDDQVNLREVARRLSVSPSAPFRHFATQRALITALAEEAALKLRLQARLALQKAPAQGVEPLRALARVFVAGRWTTPRPFGSPHAEACRISRVRHRPWRTSGRCAI